MRKLLFLLPAAILLTGLVSCHKCEKLGRRIIGTWEKTTDKGTITLEFTKDGFVNITSDAYNVNGRYYFEDTQMILITDGCHGAGYYRPNLDNKDKLVWDIDSDFCPDRGTAIPGDYVRKK